MVGSWLLSRSHFPSRLPDPDATCIVIMVHSNRTKINIDVYGYPEGAAEILHAATRYVRSQQPTPATIPAKETS